MGKGWARSVQNCFHCINFALGKEMDEPKSGLVWL